MKMKIFLLSFSFYSVILSAAAPKLMPFKTPKDWYDERYFWSDIHNRYLELGPGVMKQRFAAARLSLQQERNAILAAQVEAQLEHNRLMREYLARTSISTSLATTGASSSSPSSMPTPSATSVALAAATASVHSGSDVKTATEKSSTQKPNGK